MGVNEVKLLTLILIFTFLIGILPAMIYFYEINYRIQAKRSFRIDFNIDKNLKQQIFGSKNDGKYKKSFSKCRPMFEISLSPKPKRNPSLLSSQGEDVTPIMDRLLKAKKEKYPSTDDYMAFVDILPRMVIEENGTFTFRNKSRLTQLKGQLPYLPCKVNMYSEDDVQICIENRHNKNETFWIVFIGDSKVRNKLLFMAQSMDNKCRWKFKVDQENGTMTFSEYFKNLAKFHISSADAECQSGARLTYIEARFGPSNKAQKLFKWADLESGTPVPNAVLIDFGIWTLVQFSFDHLRSLDLIYQEWKFVIEKIKKLSEKIPVLLIAQRRKVRSESQVSDQSDQMRMEGFSWQQFFLALVQYEGSRSLYSDIMDSLMLIASEGSDAIFWDSTIPFNLAAEKECEPLIKANYSSILEETSDRRPFRRLMCHDSLHKSRPTIQDETTMVLNMMCNEFMPFTEKNVCCI